MRDQDEWLTASQFIARCKGKLGRNSVYDHLRDGSIPSIRLGRRILIPSNALWRLLEETRKADIGNGHAAGSGREASKLHEPGSQT